MKLNKKLHGIAHEGGFTLIEMLIVVGIIAIIVSIAVPAMQTAKTDAQTTKENTLKAAIGTAVQRAKINGELSDSTTGAGTEIRWSHISKYMMINGVQPACTNVSNKSENGTGKNIMSWGWTAGMSGTVVLPATGPSFNATAAAATN